VLPGSDIVDRKLFDLGGRPVTIATIVVIGSIVVSALLISRVARFFIRRSLARRGAGEARQVRSFERLLDYLIMLVAAITALETAGIDLSAVIAAGAVFAVGIGLALQSIAVNFVSGIVLLLERSIKIDDIIEFDGKICRVVELGIRATRVRTLFEEDIILPNSIIVQQPIKNLTLHDSIMRIAVTVGVAYGSDLALVRATLEQVAARHNGHDAAYVPVILLDDLGASALVFEVSVWVHDPWAHRRHRSELREAIFAACNAKQIALAYPQLDVHFDPPVRAALDRIGRAA
jgi:small-conductance mechanosensitive channel